MNRDETEDTAIYKVVVNHEEQYSIWLTDRENPFGWKDTGKSGLKTECLGYINEVWTDMRPLSLSKKMKEDGRRINETVLPFTQVPHSVVIDWPNATPQQIKDGIKRGFVPIAFTEAPELPGVGLFLDVDATSIAEADFAAVTGTIHLEGEGTVYAVGKVRGVADIDLATNTGQGKISILEPAPS